MSNGGKFYVRPSEEEITTFADQHLAPYKLRSTELIADLCPYCKGGSSGDRNTFYLSLSTGQFICHRAHCGKSGGFPSLLRHFGLAPHSRNVTKSLTALDLKTFPRTPVIDQYFSARGISTATLDHFGIAADNNGNILFPFYVEGELIYAKYRRPRPPAPNERKEWQEKGASPVLLGMDLCEPGKPLTITEGQIDCLSLYEAGVTNVVSVPCGCENFDWVETCYDWLDQFPEIIIFGDNDPPGRKMVQTLGARLGEDRCKRIEEYPDGCKDANDILLKEGELELIAVHSSAKEIPIRGLIKLSDVQAIDPTTIPRIKTMIPALDEALNGLEDGAITVFTGESGNGKSTLGGLLLLNAIEQGHSVCAYSGELPNAKFLEWVQLQCAGSNWITLKYDPVKGKNIPVLYPPAAKRISEWYSEKFFLYDSIEDTVDNTADSIMNVFTVAARRKGCKLFLVDNLMTALSDAGDEENRAQAKFIATLKRFAVRYGAHVLIVAHPRKTKSGEPIKKDDVGGNKMITNLASNVIVVERPNLRIIKARDAGNTRLIECCYCGDSRRIYQASAGDLYRYSWDRNGLTPPTIRADSMPEYRVQLAQQMF